MRLADQLEAMPFGWQVLLLAALVARVTILVTLDAITNPVRQAIRRRAGMGAYEFVACPWCVGVWCAAAMVVAFALWPRPVLVAALAGAAALAAGIAGRFGPKPKHPAPHA